MIGKLTPDDLAAYVLARTGADDGDVTVGPGYGEDAAAISVGGSTLVVSSDPISMATARIGTLGVHVACNDVAACGADPRWLTVVAFVPDGDAVDAVTRQIDEAARQVGIAVVGGHTEYAPDRDRPLLSLTCLGVTERYIPTSGARPGDEVVLTKAAGIEGTAVLATDFRVEVEADDDVVDRATGYFGDVSVIADAAAVRPYATAMHDPTEGGVIDGLVELARASGVAVEVARERVPVRPETTELCGAVGADPLRVFGSGALLATVPDGATAQAVDALGEADIPAAVIGTVEEAREPGLVLDGERIDEPGRDDLYALWE